MSLPADSPLGAEAALLFLLAWAAKATVPLTAAWVTALALRRRSAALRHQVWTIAILGSLALPFLGWSLPAWHSGLLGRIFDAWRPDHGATMTADLQMSSFSSAVSAASAAPVASTLSSRLFSELPRLALALWAFGAAWILLRLFAGVIRLSFVAARSKVLHDNSWPQTLAALSASFGVRRRVRLLECASAEAMPLTWGVFRPRIVLPAGTEQWPQERRRIVLSHELAHIRRNDWLLQVCAEWLRGLLWFHPLAWKAASRLRQESESACDDAVLNSGIEAPEYASQLLLLARKLKSPDQRLSVALAIARPSNLERRFAAMLNPSVRRGPLSRSASILALALGACLLLPLAALTLPAQTAPIQSPLAVGAPGTQAGLPFAPDAATVARGAATLTGAPTRSVPKANSPAQNVGGINGTIYDETGAVIANALITLTNTQTNTQTNAMQQTRSDGQGNFSFEAIPAGEYSLVVQAPGFRKYSAGQILAGAGRTVSLSPALQVGTVQQTVTVETDRSNAPLAPYAPSAQISVPTCGASLAQPKAPARVGDGSERAGGLVTAARITNQVQPRYPAAARASGIAGDVVLHAIIGTDGALQSVCLANADAANPDLAQAAFEAVSQWRYGPTTLDGAPLEVETTITVTFVLGGPRAQNNAPKQPAVQAAATSAARATGQTPTIQKIEYLGAERYQMEDILPYVSLYIGEPFDQELLQRNAQALRNTQHYDNVTVEVKNFPNNPNAKIVIFHLVERPAQGASTSSGDGATVVQTPATTQSSAQASAAQNGAQGKQGNDSSQNPGNGAIDLLTPTGGVNFDRYLQAVVDATKRNWYAKMPDSVHKGASGVVVLQFRILRDGSVPKDDPRITRSSAADDTLVQTATGAIRAAAPFQPLPAQFKGPSIELRLTFSYNVPLSASAGVNNGAYQAGKDGVGYPQCVYCPEPQYTEEARAAKFQGVVILSAVVTSEGRATNIEVLKGPDTSMGLEDEAIEAIKTWRFNPALGTDGKPVATLVPLEIMFRLL